ncbi:MAG: DUF6456 domain-containing protein [Roseovarius sp.]
MAAAQMIEEDQKTLTEAELRHKGCDVLRRLCEPGALLVVAANMDKAVVVRDRDGADPTRTSVVDKELAEAIALKGWIRCTQSGRLARYKISPAGRDALSHLMAEAENAAQGFSEKKPGFAGKGSIVALRDDQADDGKAKRKRYSNAEPPILVLARRKTPDGAPFLSDDMVRAGERLREDFELAQIDLKGEADWSAYMSDTAKPAAGQRDKLSDTSAQARDRVANALRDLGPGLGDVALRCCCYLEGLELAEKRMGWSARSGKVVLRIALQRLRRHYAEQGDAGLMMG